jgi:outer membrane protein assembly factor BamD (BamD/ComL family)
MPKTGEGELSYFRIGKAYYEEEDYYMAGYYMGAFTQRFPFSAKAQEAMFLSAMCSVKNSPEESLDQTETEQARVTGELVDILLQLIHRLSLIQLVAEQLPPCMLML